MHVSAAISRDAAAYALVVMTDRITEVMWLRGSCMFNDDRFGCDSGNI